MHAVSAIGSAVGPRQYLGALPSLRIPDPGLDQLERERSRPRRATIGHARASHQRGPDRRGPGRTPRRAPPASRPAARRRRAGRRKRGPAPWLDDFGLVECDEPGYPPRTKANVRDSDATLWIGDQTSPGGKVTLGECRLSAQVVVLIVGAGRPPRGWSADGSLAQGPRPERRRQREGRAGASGRGPRRSWGRCSGSPRRMARAGEPGGFETASNRRVPSGTAEVMVRVYDMSPIGNICRIDAFFVCLYVAGMRTSGPRRRGIPHFQGPHRGGTEMRPCATH